MRSLNKLVITLILLYLIWRWFNQPSENQPAPYRERRKQPYFPAESKVIAPTRQDDLTEIIGIGLKASQALQQGGVSTFAQLASLDADHIKAILKAYGLRNLDPTTWPEQAAVAARSR